MPYRDKKSRNTFYNTWKGRGYEKGETSQFWLSLLSNVLGYEHNDTVLFEHPTSTGGYIDVWIRQSDVMIEQKKLGTDLDKPEPRRGIMVTPLQQVIDYAASLPLQEQPKYLITSNFEAFRVYDRTKHGDKELEGNQFEFSLKELVDHPEYLGFILDPNNSRLRKEQEVSEQAGRLIGELYDMLREQYHDPDSEEAAESLNILCVRLVFCLFCEDAGLFGEPDAFSNYIANVQPQNIRMQLQHLFDNLDTPRENRDEYDIPIKVFPYINGGLFRKKVIIPNFTQEIKDFLLNKVAYPVNWSKISPTIFGGIFESTLNPETRRKGGMHYTSPENIHKVIDPLFLDDLKAEFEAIRIDEELSVIKRRNKYKKFHEKLCSLVFFDPACGSGNFLTETYICLKQLEFAVLKEYKTKQVTMFDSAVEGDLTLRIKLDQFYGIEINDFAVAVAETALWISRLKANQEYMLLLDLDEKDFPLTDRANIIKENALRFDWADLVEPSRVSYIMGNPPFVGTKVMSKSQKEDTKFILGNLKNYGVLDYVACWFSRTSDYILGTNIKCALVSTNSLVQGEQVNIIWKNILNRGINIDFAYHTFIWDSETEQKAHVNCVIVGFSCLNNSIKRIFTSSGIENVDNINGYLVSAPNVFIDNRRIPLCNVQQMHNGCKFLDDGHYVFTESEVKAFIENDPSSSKFIRPYLGAQNYISGEKLYCIWLKDSEPADVEKVPSVVERIERVRQFRLSCKSPDTNKYADRPMLPTRLAYYSEDRDSDMLLIPIVSSERRDYIPIGYVDKENIVSYSCMVIPEATSYTFGIMMSSVHMSWLRTVCGRLEMRFRYSNTLVYNNFPWPTPTDDQKANIEQTAQEILDARALYPDKSLAELYDPDKMPSELKAAHEANDKAVMDAYGFPHDMTEPQIVAELMKMYQQLTSTSN
jgi:type I restriction-modification system DNA methylase subunit